MSSPHRSFNPKVEGSIPSRTHHSQTQSSPERLGQSTDRDSGCLRPVISLARASRGVPGRLLSQARPRLNAPLGRNRAGNLSESVQLMPLPRTCVAVRLSRPADNQTPGLPKSPGQPHFCPRRKQYANANMSVDWQQKPWSAACFSDLSRVSLSLLTSSDFVNVGSTGDGLKDRRALHRRDQRPHGAVWTTRENPLGAPRSQQHWTRRMLS